MRFDPTHPFAVAVNEARSPRAIVQINGITVLWESITLITTYVYVASTYMVRLPLNDQPDPLDFNYWSMTGILTVKIYIGFPLDPNNYGTGDLDLMIVGDCTDFEIEPLTGYVTMHGRDLSSRLIDKKVTKTFGNFTTSQIIQQFADDNQLTPQVTPTKTVMGNLFYNQQFFISNDSTQWDAIMTMARLDNFYAYVDGETLVYEPVPVPDNVKNPFILQYSPPTFDNPSPAFNGMHFSLSRTMALASDVQVTVSTPINARTGTSFSSTAKSSHRDKGFKFIPKGNVKKYNHVISGLTPEQATNRATSILESLINHETRLHAFMPGSNLLKRNSLIKVTGTNTDFDQIYYPDEVVRRISPEKEGYTMQIMAKNRSQNVNT